MANEEKNETWRPVRGYAQGRVKYFVSDKGRVKSLWAGKETILRQNPQTSGYLSVHLYTNGFQVCALVHRLVCEAFHPNPEEKPCVNHINGIKTCNDADNLEWVTHYENTHSGGTLEKIKKNKGQAILAIEIQTTGRRQEPLCFDCVQDITDIFGICYESLVRALDNNAKTIKPVKTFKDITNPRFVPDMLLKDMTGRMWLFNRIERKWDNAGNIRYTSPHRKKRLKTEKSGYVPATPVTDKNGLVTAELPRDIQGNIIEPKTFEEGE